MTRLEVAGHQRAGRRLLAVAGSGGVAEELAECGVAPTGLAEAVLGRWGSPERPELGKS